MDTTLFERLKKRFLGIGSSEIDVSVKPARLQNKGVQKPVAGMVQSRRKDDMSAEAQLGIFLDTYLYKNFPNRESFAHVERIHNKAEQLAGVDVRFTCKDGAVYDVDEKAQLYYLNKDLPTFAFEIQFLRNGVETVGWLCSESLLTDLYLLIWPFASQDTPKGIRWDQFTKADCLLVQKKRLLSLLASEGLTPEIMAKKASDLRKRGCIGKVAVPDVKGIYYYASDPEKYREAPINIVITKEKLIKIAQRRYIVTEEGVEVQPATSKAVL